MLVGCAATVPVIVPEAEVNTLALPPNVSDSVICVEVGTVLTKYVVSVASTPNAVPANLIAIPAVTPVLSEVVIIFVPEEVAVIVTVTDGLSCVAK